MSQLLEVDIEGDFYGELRKWNLARMAGVSGVLAPLNSGITVRLNTGVDIVDLPAIWQRAENGRSAELTLVDPPTLPISFTHASLIRDRDTWLWANARSAGSIEDTVLTIDY